MCCGLRQEGLREGGGNCLKYFKWGWNQKKGRRTKDFKKEGASWIRMNAFEKGGLESPYEAMMFTCTLMQDFFIYFYLFIIYFTLSIVILHNNNIAIHCKMFYAYLSQQLHIIKTNERVLHGEKLQASN